MQSFKPDSLSCLIHSCGLFRKVDMSSADLPSVVKELNSYMSWQTPYPKGFSPAVAFSKEPLEGVPEVDALMFYLLNHLVSVVCKEVHPYESLGKFLPVVELYREQLAIRSTRMFFYLLLICTRESRHTKNAATLSFSNAVKTKFGVGVYEFHRSIRGSGSTSAVERLRNSPPACSMGTFVQFLQYAFYHGSFSGGYGGHAWGKIADCLANYVLGSYSAEMMMDTAFTLCHNNGPIFNKGMLFNQYTHEIYKILDVQRSGQIPALLAAKETSYHSNNVIAPVLSLLRSVMPEEFGSYVDWFKVEALGALKSYPKQKEAQKAKGLAPGVPVSVTTGLKFSKDNLKKALLGDDVPVGVDISDLVEGEEDMDTSSLAKWLQIMPNLKVQIVEVR